MDVVCITAEVGKAVASGSLLGLNDNLNAGDAVNAKPSSVERASLGIYIVLFVSAFTHWLWPLTDGLVFPLRQLVHREHRDSSQEIAQ